jgi:hypothetical protein
MVSGVLVEELLAVVDVMAVGFSELMVAVL